MNRKCRMQNAKCRREKYEIRLSAFFILLPSSFILSACAPYAQAQTDLLDQSRRGIVMARQTQASYAAVVDQLHDLQRQRIDDAFDADVREQKSLSADWVIESRKAYAAAVDAMAQQQAAAKQSAVGAQQNLDAIDQAMQRVRWLVTLPLSWFGSNDSK